MESPSPTTPLPSHRSSPGRSTRFAAAPHVCEFTRTSYYNSIHRSVLTNAASRQAPSSRPLHSYPEIQPVSMKLLLVRFSFSISCSQSRGASFGAFNMLSRRSPCMTASTRAESTSCISPKRLWYISAEDHMLQPHVNRFTSMDATTFHVVSAASCQLTPLHMFVCMLCSIKGRIWGR